MDTTDRDAALAALREHTAPGRRAELIAAAWTAGERRVTALAEAARISRPTVYADLRSRGIDPDQHRQEEPMTSTDTLVLDGMDGTAADHQKINVALAAYLLDHGQEGVSAEESRLYRLHCAIEHHNTHAHAATAERDARRERDRALAVVENRWNDLSSAKNFLAAHHAYVVAVDEAHRALDTWRAAARDLDRVVARRDDAGLAEPDPRLPALPTKPRVESADDAEFDRLRLDLTEQHARREQLVAQTLALVPEQG